LGVRKIEGHLIGEVRSHPCVVAAGVCVCWVPVRAGRHRAGVRWYLRFNLSYRDVEEMLVERGVDVDHVTVFRWVQRFVPLLADAARLPAGRRATGGSVRRVAAVLAESRTP
jgi:hypothetical protein